MLSFRPNLQFSRETLCTRRRSFNKSFNKSLNLHIYIYLGDSIIGRTIDVTTKTTPDPLTEDSVNPLENLDLTKATLKSKGTTLPSCAGLHYETHTLNAEEDSVLTVDGTLIVSKYENGVGENPGKFTTEFCVDL